MNATQAKSLSLLDVLQRQGHQPVEIRKGGRELWFLSPFRDEQTPSFTVDVSKNIWNDFGEAGIGSQVCAGGKVIDYMMKYHGTDAKGALEEVNKLYNGLPQKPSPKATKKEAMPITNTLEIISVKKVFSMALFHYLEARKIPREIGLPYLKQVQFRHVEKKTEGFALGLENRAGGYEIRSKHFKGLVGRRDITVIRGAQSGLNIQMTEGLFDFLSLLCIYGRKRPQSDVIILNGASMIKAGIDHIKRHGYRNVQSWFDNDQGGQKATALLKEAFESSAIKVKSQNHKYSDFKDISEMHENLDLAETRKRFGLG